ncbi:hypothetical protein AAHC03_0530 [Spirometra sp. Aus1]
MVALLMVLLLQLAGSAESYAQAAERSIRGSDEFTGRVVPTRHLPAACSRGRFDDSVPAPANLRAFGDRHTLARVRPDTAAVRNAVLKGDMK